MIFCYGHLPVHIFHGVIGRRALHACERKAVTKFNALHRGDGEHHVRELALQGIKEGIAQAHGKSRDHALHDAAHRVLLCFRGKDGGFHFFACFFIEDRKLLLCQRRKSFLALAHRVEAPVFDACHILRMGADVDALRRQDLPRDGAGESQRRGDATGEMAAAAVVLKAAVFHPARIVRMPRAHGIPQDVVVRGVLVAISDFHGQRRPRGMPIEKAGKDFESIFLLSRRGHSRTPRRPASHFFFDFFPVDGNPRRKPVDHAADGRPVGFTKDGDFQCLSKCIAHTVSLW